MNNKGLTLVELIAVIAIIALIALIAYPPISKNLSKSKNNMKNIQESTVKEAAIEYVSDNLGNEDFFSSNRETVTLKVLIDEGYITGSTKNAKTNREYDLENSRVVINRTGTYPNYTYNYQITLYDK